MLSPNFNSNTSCREKDDRVNIQGILLGGDQLSTAMARRVIADYECRTEFEWSDTSSRGLAYKIMFLFNSKLCILAYYLN